MVELLWKNMLVCAALEDQYVKSVGSEEKNVKSLWAKLL